MIFVSRLRQVTRFLPVAFFFFKQKTAYDVSACLVGSEMCIRDRVGTQEDHAAFFLQLVVQADKVVEYRFGKLVGFVKYKERSVHLDNVVKDKAPDLTDIAALRAYADRAGYLTDEITFFHVLGTKDIDCLLYTSDAADE